jgi:hypothetical protein
MGIIALFILAIPILPTNAQFVLASSYDLDEYGQGIDAFWVYENSTGSWETSGDYRTNNETQHLYEWNASLGIKIHYFTWFNNTLIGASDSADGKNYHRHNVTVTDTTGTVIFSQQNFTYNSVSTANDPMWFYNYYVVLNFLPEYGDIYTVKTTYEVFY